MHASRSQGWNTLINPSEHCALLGPISTSTLVTKITYCKRLISHRIIEFLNVKNNIEWIFNRSCYWNLPAPSTMTNIFPPLFFPRNYGNMTFLRWWMWFSENILSYRLMHNVLVKKNCSGVGLECIFPHSLHLPVGMARASESAPSSHRHTSELCSLWTLPLFACIYLVVPWDLRGCTASNAIYV